MRDMVDALPMEAVQAPVFADDPSVPHVTHRGLLRIGDDGVEIEVFQLSDGQRIITEAGFEKFLKFLEKDR